MSRTGRKRKGYPSRYDRGQDKRLKTLEAIIEKKNHTPTTITHTSAYTAGTALIDDLNFAIAQGDGVTARTGNEIVNLSISYRCRAFVNAVVQTATTGATLLRFMIIWDRKPQNTILASTDVLVDATVQGLYNINKEFSGRFQVLRDEVFALPSATANDEGGATSYPEGNAVFWKGFIDLKKKKTVWTGSTGTQTSVEKGQLVLLTITSNGTTNDTTFVMAYRIFYKG